VLFFFFFFLFVLFFSLGSDDRLLVLPHNGVFDATKFVPLTASTSSSSAASSSSSSSAIASLEVKMPRALALFPDETSVLIGSLRKLTVAKIDGPRYLNLLYFFVYIFVLSCMQTSVEVVASVDTSYDVNAVAAGPGEIVAVGGQDQFVHLLKLDADAKTLTQYGLIECMLGYVCSPF
jgi:hypothetical protein